MQTNLLPYLTRLLPLAVGNGDAPVRLREIDEFQQACVVTVCDTQSTDVARNQLTTCKPAGVLQMFEEGPLALAFWHSMVKTLLT
jgi:hypothetical protein